jgi:hypothetical protein
MHFLHCEPFLLIYQRSRVTWTCSLTTTSNIYYREKLFACYNLTMLRRPYRNLNKCYNSLKTVNNMHPKQLNEESLKTQLSQDFWWVFLELSYVPNEFFYLCVNCILNRYVVPNVLCLHLKNVIYAARMVCTISQVCLRFLSGQPSTPTLGSIKSKYVFSKNVTIGNIPADVVGRTYKGTGEMCPLNIHRIYCTCYWNI